jgi:hypothetical protein
MDAGSSGELMAKENSVKKEALEPEIEGLEPGVEATPAPKSDKKGLRSTDASRYVRYALFLVAIGMVYIWNSHVAEGQVRRENKLKKEVADRKAEYKTMHARLSAGTRQSAIQFRVQDTLGLHASSKNIYQLKRD